MIIYIDYSKEKLKTRGTLIYCNEELIKYSSKLYKYMKSELIAWVQDLIPILMLELNDDEFTIEFYGNIEDYELISREVEKNNVGTIKVIKVEREKFINPLKEEIDNDLNEKENSSFKHNEHKGNQIDFKEDNYNKEVEGARGIKREDKAAEEIIKVPLEQKEIKQEAKKQEQNVIIVSGEKFFIIEKRKETDKTEKGEYIFTETVEKLSLQNLLEFLNKVCQIKNEQYCSIIKIERMIKQVRGIRFRIEQIIVDSDGKMVYKMQGKNMLYGRIIGCLLLPTDIMKVLGENDVLIIKTLLSGE